MELKDISKQERAVIKMIKGNCKEKINIKIFSCGAFRFICSVSSKGKTQFSGSGPYGPVSIHMLMEAFKQVVNKDIVDFKVHMANEALHLIEI